MSPKKKEEGNTLFVGQHFIKPYIPTKILNRTFFYVLMVLFFFLFQTFVTNLRQNKRLQKLQQQKICNFILIENNLKSIHK